MSANPLDFSHKCIRGSKFPKEKGWSLASLHNILIVKRLEEMGFIPEQPIVKRLEEVGFIPEQPDSKMYSRVLA